LEQIKVGAEFAIGSSEQVEIKHSGHAEFVVVGYEQLRAGFFQVRSLEESVARLKNASDCSQKLRSYWTVEVPNRAAPRTTRTGAARPCGTTSLPALHPDIRVQDPQY